MGSVQIDIHKADHRLSQRYNLCTYKGVTSLLSAIHHLRSKRLTGDIDVTILLVDFEQALKDAPLTAKQRQALYLRFERDLPLEDVALAMEITKGGVLNHIRQAAHKIVKMFRGTPGYS